MLREISRHESIDSDDRSVLSGDDDLRSIMAASTKLPPSVVAAGFTNVYDRVLDDETIATITDPTSCQQDDVDDRCRRRKKALAPYGGKRLVCVLISLPGVVYTVEIDPYLQKVIYWECQAQ